MQLPPSIELIELSADTVSDLQAMLELFGRVFEDPATYGKHPPSETYLKSLLQSDHFIAIAARQESRVIGGLAAYELKKFEQERSEIYIYDLAVAETHRRQGIATAMIQKIKHIAATRNAWVVYVQANQGDTPPIQLYSKLGKREDVLHFDINPNDSSADFQINKTQR